MLDQGGEGQMERERDVNNVCKYEKGAGSIGSSIVRGWAADRFPSDALRPGNILTWTFVSHWGRPDGRRPATGPTRHGPHTGNHWPTRNIGRIIFSCDIYCLPRGSFFKSHPHRTSLFIVYLALDYLFSSSGCPRTCVSIDSIFPTHRILRHFYDRCHGMFFRLIPLNYLN